MNRYTLSHLSDQTLMRELRALVSRDRATTALLIAHLGEVDSRRLYAEAGYPSMFSYCVEELRFSEESAYKRIRVARTARQFPAIHGMLADGRLHLSAVVLLASCLTAENAEGLLAAAAHRSKAGVEQLLAGKFPRPDLPSLIQPVSAARPPVQLSPGTVNFSPTELPTQALGDAVADDLPSPTTVMR